jgi:hypothetical protein
MGLFRGAGTTHSTLTINIGANVQRIPAFMFCSRGNRAIKNLKQVNFAVGGVLTEIGHSAFQYNDELTEIIIPNTVTSLGRNAFYECSKLTYAPIPTSLTQISVGTFAYCTSLREITIPAQITSLTANSAVNTTGAFAGCTGLEIVNYNAINISDLSAQPNIFRRMGIQSGGVTIKVGASVTRIPAYLFASQVSESATSGYVRINSVEFADNGVLTTIGRNAFSNNQYLTEIILPEGLTALGQEAFYNCTRLVNKHISSTLTRIETSTFALCGLTTITIPENITFIGNSAFDRCRSVTTIYFNAINHADRTAGLTSPPFASVGEQAGGVTLIIGNKVTRIPGTMFANSTTITSVVFAENSVCTTIGASAFEATGSQAIIHF